MYLSQMIKLCISIFCVFCKCSVKKTAHAAPLCLHMFNNILSYPNKHRFTQNQSFGSRLILTGYGSNLLGQAGPGSNLSGETGSMTFSRQDPDPDPDTSVLKIFHLFYDEFE